MSIVDNFLVLPPSNKLFCFAGLHYKRWRLEVQFFLSVKKVVYVLNTDKPVLFEESTDKQKKQLHSSIDDDYLYENFYSKWTLR